MKINLLFFSKLYLILFFGSSLCMEEGDLCNQLKSLNLDDNKNKYKKTIFINYFKYNNIRSCAIFNPHDRTKKNLGYIIYLYFDKNKEEYIKAIIPQSKNKISFDIHTKKQDPDIINLIKSKIIDLFSNDNYR
jgi:hypothetical protein